VLLDFKLFKYTLDQNQGQRWVGGDASRPGRPRPEPDKYTFAGGVNGDGVSDFGKPVPSPVSQ